MTLRFYYRDSELNGNTEANLNIWRYTGGSWKKYVPTRDTNSNYVEATVEVPSGSSDWVLSDAGDDQSLPVGLTSAIAVFEGGVVKLEWKVASEVNNQGFEIARRELPDGRYFQIGFVEGRGTESTSHRYEFQDHSVRSGHSYAYRITSISPIGERQVLADELIVHVGDFLVKFMLEPNRPNPFRKATTLSFGLPERSEVTIRIYDIRGRLVRTLNLGQLVPGRYRIVWHGCDDFGRNLSAGLYLYELDAGGHRAFGKMVRVK